MRIAVLGGGNGSFAAAGDMALAGHEVRLWRRDRAAVEAHNAAGGTIIVKDFRGCHPAKPALITNDIGAAVNGAELIVCPTPATAQHDIARALAPHLTDGQVVFLPPGTFGSYIFAKAMCDAGNRADVAFAETGTLPWLTRKHGPHEVAITIRAKRLPTGVLPLRLKDHALAVISRAFPGVIEGCGDALSAALMNAGPIIHPPLIVMNAAPLEHFPRWDIHKEGTQASVRRVTDALDAERIAIREALGYGAPHFPLANHYATEGEEWMYGRGSHDKLGSVYPCWSPWESWPACRPRSRARFSALAARFAARISWRADARCSRSDYPPIAKPSARCSPRAFHEGAHRLSRRGPHGTRHCGRICVCGT
jgi:opine dehydrogenase